jgi:5-hydroxyisourate hydrolase-like protein (transthyretin family)
MPAALIENYGQLQVTDAATANPLSKVCVKVYARGNNGVKFFKDGYTDFRGRFDYVSLNTNELDGADRLALLAMDDEHGTLVREAAPPKR